MISVGAPWRQRICHFLCVRDGIIHAFCHHVGHELQSILINANGLCVVLLCVCVPFMFFCVQGNCY